MLPDQQAPFDGGREARGQFLRRDCYPGACFQEPLAEVIGGDGFATQLQQPIFVVGEGEVLPSQGVPHHPVGSVARLPPLKDQVGTQHQPGGDDPR